LSILELSPWSPLWIDLSALYRIRSQQNSVENPTNECQLGNADLPAF